MKKIISLILICITGLSAPIYASNSKNPSESISPSATLKAFGNMSSKYDTERDMKSKYNAVPCTNEEWVNRFNNIQKNLGIKDNVQLFEIQSLKPGAYIQEALSSYFDDCKAFYDPLLQTITINQPRNFSKNSPTVQDFIFYHELRHHLQKTTKQAQNSIDEYSRRYYIAYHQIMEYDADTFALQSSGNCPHCIQEISNIQRTAFFTTYTQDGYLTSQGVKPFLDAAKKNPIICHRHKAMSKIHLACNIVKSKLLNIVSTEGAGGALWSTLILSAASLMNTKIFKGNSLINTKSVTLTATVGAITVIKILDYNEHQKRLKRKKYHQNL